MKTTRIFSSFLLILILAININASDKNIVETAVAADDFNTLAKALTEAGLLDALQAEGPFTVFAPTDAAFAKLPEGTLESLLNDKEALTQILLYHVVKGKVMASDVVNLSEAETLSGQKINIKVNESVVLLNDSKVTTTDIQASNGVIHVIDTVLLPSYEEKQAKSKKAY